MQSLGLYFSQSALATKASFAASYLFRCLLALFFMFPAFFSACHVLSPLTSANRLFYCAKMRCTLSGIAQTTSLFSAIFALNIYVCMTYFGSLKYIAMPPKI